MTGLTGSSFGAGAGFRRVYPRGSGSRNASRTFRRE